MEDNGMSPRGQRNDGELQTGNLCTTNEHAVVRLERTGTTGQ